MLPTMSDDLLFRRSPELMSRQDTALVVVDVQQKLIPLVPGHPRIIWNIRRLLDAAKMLGLPRGATEQYPQGLGPTVAELAERLATVPSKVAFSSLACREVFDRFEADGIEKFLIVGIETHVCIQQTVLDLLAAGARVYVAVDAVGARHRIDHETALWRMDSAGATLTTTEAAIFEWCQTAAAPEFKRISQLIQERAPEDATSSKPS